MTVNPNYNLTPAQRREAEMRRGQEVQNEVHGHARQFIAKTFDPDYVPPTPTHHVSEEGKEYARRLREANKGRPDIK